MARLVFCLLAVGLTVSQAVFWDDLKIDCGVSVWSVWGPTVNKHRTRTREIFRYPQNGGAPCPHLTETDTDPWATHSVPEKASMVKSSFISGISQSSSSRKRRQTTIRPRDFLFIIDSSGSIGNSYWTLTTNKLSELIGVICGEIGLETQNNRAAVITYSRNTTEHFDFKFHTTTASAQNAIKKLPYKGQSTCTGTALNYAQSMFDPSKGARHDSISEKEVILLTDGMANCGPEQINAAHDLKNIKSPPMPLFVFAIGKAFDKAKIDQMASTPSSTHLFHFVSFPEFADVVDEVLKIPYDCVPIEIKG